MHPRLARSLVLLFALRPAQIQPLALALSFLAALSAHAGPATEGQWRGGLVPMGDVGVHATLLRGASDAFHWMWWEGDPGDPNATYHVRNYTPGYSFSFNTVGNFTIPQPGNAFCSGHVQLANGDLFLAGAQDYSGIEGLGASTAYRFDPGTNQFTQLAHMGVERYYPTASFLPSGKVLMSSGGTYELVPSFGGRSQTNVQGDLHGMKITPYREWLDAEDEGPVSGTPPPAIEGHTIVMDRDNAERLLVFGGREGGGQLHDEVWVLAGNTVTDAHQVVWTWSVLATTGDPALGGMKPSPRFEHAAAFAGGKMYVFGGSDGTNAFGDLWMLDFAVSPQPQWTRLYNWQSGSPGPSPRWGHSMVVPRSGISIVALYVFGGRDQTQFRSDDNWRYIPGDDWEQLASSGTPRIDHVAAAIDNPVTSTAAPLLDHMLIFGGRDPNGAVLGDTRYYRYPELSPGNTWSEGPSSGPSARAGAASFSYFDAYTTTVTIHGGKLANGTYSSTTWLYSSKYATWYSRSTYGGPEARANHAMAPFSVDGHEHAKLLIARHQELYEPTGSTGGLPGSWTDLPATSNRLISLYSDMFLLPTGKVFHAGPDVSTRVLEVATGTWGAPLPAASGHRSATAVQYLPGKIMRFGGPGNGQSSTGDTETIAFDANGNTSGWQIGAISTLPRVNPNLTVLPTGEVLATGGEVPGSGDGFQRQPQLWNPTTRTWGAALPADPGQRGYHSTAILLPDGRLVAAGGFSSASGTLAYSVYEPYYLFDASGAPITQQPTITSAPATLEYGGAFSIGTASPSLVTSVCLIRPGATTHTVDFDQRYIPLSFWRCGGGSSPIRAYAPANGRIAPPGNYMLFIVQTINGRKVPSIAKWVRLPDTSLDQDPPAAVNLYTGAACQNYAVLNWIAPAANGAAGTGTALEYDLRVAASGITDQSFDCESRITLPFTPAAPGTPETFTVTGLNCNTNYSFAIKARDGVSHWGPMSNVPSAKPYCLGPWEFCEDGLFAINPTDAPKTLELSAPFPNPAETSPSIRLSVPSSMAGERLELAVFDPAGRRVAMLADGPAQPGVRLVRWNLRNEGGSAVRRGVYFIRLQIGGTTMTRTLIATHGVSE